MPTAPTAPVGTPDTHGIGMAVSRLSNSSKKSAKVALGILSAILADGEIIECLSVGKYLEADGLIALTNQRLIVLNDRQWVPDQIELRVDTSLTVRGEKAGSTASLALQRDAVTAILSRVSDLQVIEELAQRIRARAAATPA